MIDFCCCPFKGGGSVVVNSLFIVAPAFCIWSLVCCAVKYSVAFLLSCQPRVTVTSCFVYKVIRDLESVDHLCINPIRRIGLIHVLSVDYIS